MGDTVIRRISGSMDKAILETQSAMIKADQKPVSYPEASKFYAEISFNGKTNVIEAVKKMVRYKA
jgi:hypothetical protein